ncbi:hypothetical protein LDO26_08880 [Luteimonas sp. BDR2-5]|uniref:hypothetical protein n=1 Tax=Proluteimonas luteida TaxID=2878685 RepID=UPI001E53836F|nr:hypothetical protein [Luteimonas sp. BDR2-5]MCD9028322.1 hypothetical protein [Luteimonas sp. BDR2-5]
MLGLSVAALVSGLAQVLHERERIRFGWLTPMLAVFVALDITTFWNQAWIIFRGAPFNIAILVTGLAIAATFYVAASVTFPRVSAGGVERLDLDEYFWANRRLVFACIMTSNLIVVGLFCMLAAADPGFASMASSVRLWVGLAIFVVGTATAAFASRRRVAIGALVMVLAYSLWNLTFAARTLIAGGGWSPAIGGA